MEIINPTELSADTSFYSRYEGGLFEIEFSEPIKKNYRFSAEDPYDALSKFKHYLGIYQRAYQNVIRHRLNKGKLIRVKIRRFEGSIEDNLEE